jgi:hypothetical protein
MATRPTQAAQNRQGSSGGIGSGGSSMDVGHAAVARMAREDTQWFVVAVVILSLVLFLALPLSLLVLVETERMKSDVRYEIKQLNKLRKELKEQYANRPADKPASSPDGL